MDLKQERFGAPFFMGTDMATNQLMPFGMGESPNRISYEDWNILPARLTGFQSGIASSQQFNYILAQGGVAGYIIGQLIVEQLVQDATLNDAATLFANFKTALAKFIPSGIADQSIVTSKLKDLSVTAAKLAAGGVTAEKIASNAVITEKILDLAITTEKLNNGSVTNEKIKAGTIAFDRLASAAIATREQAIAGILNNVLMTPEMVAAAINALVPPAVPTGMVAYFALTAIPEGWLLCNGANVSRTTYAALFTAIGTKFGSGDGSTTFTLPNLNERFIEGTTSTSKVGTKLEAGLPNITGAASFYGTEAINQTSGSFWASNDLTHEWGGHSNEVKTFPTLHIEGSNSSAIYGKSSTVQPSALLLLPCIKF